MFFTVERRYTSNREIRLFLYFINPAITDADSVMPDHGSGPGKALMRNPRPPEFIPSPE